MKPISRVYNNKNIPYHLYTFHYDLVKQMVKVVRTVKGPYSGKFILEND